MIHRTGLKGTVSILEGLNRQTVEVLGERFSIHPSVFLDFAISTDGLKARAHQSATRLLASTWAAQSHLVLKYRGLISLDDESASLHRPRCARTGRYIATARVNGRRDGVGMLHRKAVFWKEQKQPQGRWDCPYLSPLITDTIAIVTY
jgi:hypothetical protein